ncbi:hypothetical protein RD792_010491 [Penstemon davidsonii]|uniref:CG-1 domain-containing protein n=1 Tax=Penstemon davidsonii TaxID=160366 RepID=A0ABR0D375_9LAMI|nr:hypothetical protein RD792_010491 [Penstemon davidsonii]
MMENSSVPSRLVGSEIHGFHTMAGNRCPFITWTDLDVVDMMEEAKARWLRPNEIHAILCNHKYFKINVKPMNSPESNSFI